MKEALKQWLRSYGVTKQHLNFPQYYVPYLMGRGRAFVPQSLTLELTFRCNLSCVMCPLDLPRIMHDGERKDFVKERKGVELTSPEVHRIIDDLAKFGVKNLTLTGGEVFLRHDALEIIEHVKKTPMKLCVNTNGWYLRPQIADRLVVSPRTAEHHVAAVLTKLGATTRAEAARIVLTSAGHSGLTSDDRTYLVRLVAGTTGLQPPDAEKRVDTIVGEARENIRSARRTAVVLAFMTGAAALLGAAIAWFAANAGGRHRDGGVAPSMAWDWRGPRLER